MKQGYCQVCCVLEVCELHPEIICSQLILKGKMLTMIRESTSALEDGWEGFGNLFGACRLRLTSSWVLARSWAAGWHWKKFAVNCVLGKLLWKAGVRCAGLAMDSLLLINQSLKGHLWCHLCAMGCYGDGELQRAAFKWQHRRLEKVNEWVLKRCWGIFSSFPCCWCTPAPGKPSLAAKPFL